MTAGYLDEDEGWRWVAGLGLALRQDFGSWDDLATNYRGGEAFFCAMNALEPAHEGLLDWLSESERSPWRRVAWDIGPEALAALVAD